MGRGRAALLLWWWRTGWRRANGQTVFVPLDAIGTASNRARTFLAARRRRISKFVKLLRKEWRPDIGEGLGTQNHQFSFDAGGGHRAAADFVFIEFWRETSEKHFLARGAELLGHFLGLGALRFQNFSQRGFLVIVQNGR